LIYLLEKIVCELGAFFVFRFVNNRKKIDIGQSAIQNNAILDESMIVDKTF